MTSPPSPCPPVPPAPSVPNATLGITPAAEARMLAVRACGDVDDAAADARHSLAVSWESDAADRFRQEVADLLTGLGADRQLVEEAAAVLAR
ncbi:MULTISPECIES: hypothetical protein [unclassified Isoptericola]|uniref:hypothetical protein n=1 Tax=unclassified Isoptericola TaxID=2623355 RepID=UPI0036682DF3